MLQKEEKEENELIKISDFKVWKLKEDLSNDDIIQRISKNQNKIRYLTEILNEDEKHDKKKKQNYQSFDSLRKRRKNKDSKISTNVKKIMTDVGKLVLDMKNISENTYKANINSLIKTSKEIKKTEIMDENNIILKLKEKEYKASLEGKIKKVPNFQFLSDCYRKQINKTFVNYNPNVHLSNMHKLRETKPETEKEYQARKAEIDELTDINNYMFGKGFLKNYKINNKDNNRQDIKNNLGGNGNDNTKGYTLQTAESDTNNNNNNNNNQIIPPQILNMYGKKKPKVEIKRKFPDKEKREKELNLMSSVLANIDDSISKQNIGNYFDRYKELQGTEIPQQKHIFFNGMGKANKLLTEIQEVLHYKDTDEEANTKRKQTTVESDNLVDKLGTLKKFTINEIDAFEKKENKIYLQK